MRHRDSVSHGLLKRVPRTAFDRLVAARGADRGVRRLRSRDRLIALLYGQLSGANSLREIVGGLHSRKARLYHVGARRWPTPMPTVRLRCSPPCSPRRSVAPGGACGARSARRPA